MYGKVQKSGVIKILPEIYIYEGPALSKAEGLILLLISSQSALVVSNCSGLRCNPCRTGWWAKLFVLAILIFLYLQYLIKWMSEKDERRFFLD